MGGFYVCNICFEHMRCVAQQTVWRSWTNGKEGLRGHDLYTVYRRLSDFIYQLTMEEFPLPQAREFHLYSTLLPSSRYRLKS